MTVNRGNADPVVFLCRHGRTTLNAEGRLRGLSDPPLDDVGQTEAQALASVISHKHPTLVIASQMRRAVATAEAIAAAAHVHAIVDARLQDRNYGVQSGRLVNDVVQEFGSIDAAPDVEPVSHLTERARVGFQQLVDEHGTGPLVFVAHDAINKAILADIDPGLTMLAQPTGCWNELRYRDGAWHVEVYDQKPSGP